MKSNSEILIEYSQWLETFGQGPFHEFNQISDQEAKLTQVKFGKQFKDWGFTIEPIFDDKNKSPDFSCSKDGCKFEVEVTCIKTDTIEKVTGLKNIDDGKPSFHGTITNAVFNETIGKTKQCSERGIPVILAIGIFHSKSPLLLMPHLLEECLTGKSYITMDFDPAQGKAVGGVYQTTKLEQSVCLKQPKVPDDSIFARKPISGIIFGGFGVYPNHYVGLLHPSPNYPIDPAIFPSIKFGKLIEQQNNLLKVEWVN